MIKITNYIKYTFLLTLSLLSNVYADTPTIHPRADNQGSVGTSALRFSSGNIVNLTVSTMSGSGVNLTGPCTAQIFYGDGSKLTGIVSGGGGVSVYPATSNVLMGNYAITQVSSMSVYMIVSTGAFTNIYISTTFFTGNISQQAGSSSTFKGNVFVDGQFRAPTSDCYINYLHGNGAWYMASDHVITGEGAAAAGVDNKIYLFQGQQSGRRVTLYTIDDTGGTGAQVGSGYMVIGGEKHAAADFQLKGTTQPTVILLSAATLPGYGTSKRINEYGKFYHDGNNFNIASGTGTSGTSGGIGIIPSDNPIYYSTWSPTGLNLVGDIKVSSRPFCNMIWCLLDSSLTVVATGDVFTEFAGTSAIVTSAWFLPRTNNAGVFYRGTSTHTFQVTLTGCLSTPSATATIAKVAIFKNGTIVGTHTSAAVPVQNDDVSISVNAIVSLATGEFVDARVTTDDGDDVNIDDYQMSIIPID